MTQVNAGDFYFKIPSVLRESDLEKGEKSLGNARVLFGVIQAEIVRAENELLMVHTIKMVDSLKGLERIDVSASGEHQEGVSYISLSVECYHDDEDDYNELTSDALRELIIDASELIYDSDMRNCTGDDKKFISGLARAMFGTVGANIWFAKREAAELGDMSKKTERSMKARAL